MAGPDLSLLLPVVSFAALVSLGYPVGRAGWIWVSVLFSTGAILAIIGFVAAWSFMPTGMDRVIYLAIAVFLLLPALFGALIGVYLGRRTRRKPSEAVVVPSP